MYGWIWRRLPFGIIGKLIGSTVLVLAAVALLWFLAFPVMEPLLPFDDVQVSDPVTPTVPTTGPSPAR
jgi:hypothetical protein